MTSKLEHTHTQCEHIFSDLRALRIHDQLAIASSSSSLGRADRGNRYRLDKCANHGEGAKMYLKDAEMYWECKKKRKADAIQRGCRRQRDARESRRACCGEQRDKNNRVTALVCPRCWHSAARRVADRAGQDRSAGARKGGSTALVTQNSSLAHVLASSCCTATSLSA